MAEATGAAVSGDDIPTDYTMAPIRGDVVEVYESMLAAVPDAGGDGMDGILAAIAAATDVSHLDAPWRSAGLEAFVNQPLVIMGIRKLPSSYQGGLAWFLVVDAGIPATGELVTITTGSVSVVAQLVKAHQLDSFPLRVMVRQSERPSAAGFYPQHLEIVK
jgi:hypothetical protein